MKEITIWLNESNSIVNYPFIHKIGERVKSNIDGREGVVTNAQFVGADSPGGAYKITYYIKTENGEELELPMIELEKVS